MAVGVSGGGRLRGALNRIVNRLGPNPLLRVGFLENATYPNGTPVAMVAAIQNFGAPRAGIPPRPFFTQMIAKHKTEWAPQVGRVLKERNYDAKTALGVMGQVIAGELRQSIIDLDSPPLGPVTLMLRKMRQDNPNLVVTARTVGIAAARVKAGMSYAGVSTKPLVDTGVLLGSIDYEVTGRK